MTKEPEFHWSMWTSGDGSFLGRRTLGGFPEVRVYPDNLRGSGWFVEPWSGPPPLNPLRFEFLADAKTYCEVTLKLYG